MNGVSRMHKQGRSAGTVKGGDNFLTDYSTFAYPADHYPSITINYDINAFCKGIFYQRQEPCNSPGLLFHGTFCNIYYLLICHSRLNCRVQTYFNSIIEQKPY